MTKWHDFYQKQGVAPSWPYPVDYEKELEVDTDVAELSLEEFEELVDVIAAPLVEHVRQELEEVPAVEPTLDLFDLLLRERLEDVLAQRLGITLLDRILRRETNLPNRTFSENDLHRSFSENPSRDESQATNTQSHRAVSTLALY